MKKQGWPHERHLGAVLRTPWSDVTVAEIITTYVKSQRTFLGIRGAIIDHASWDWPSPETLLWVVKEECGLALWQPWIHDAHVPPAGLDKEIEAIIGHHEHLDETFVAIKWIGRDCPSWEIEASLENSMKLTTYWASLTEGGSSIPAAPWAAATPYNQ